MSRPSQRSDTIHTRRLRSACDVCHQAKTRCSGGEPCTACRNSGYDCVYSVSQRLGRPKGTTKHNAQRQRAANTSSAASATGTAATCFTNSALYKTISPFDAEMSIDSSAVINPESLLGPSPKSFWDWMGHDAISNAGLLFNEDQSYLHAPSFSRPQSVVSKECNNPANDVMVNVDERTHFAPTSALEYNIPPLPTTVNMQHTDNAFNATGTAAVESQNYPNLYSHFSNGASTHDKSNACDCLQHHADLLCRLGQLKKSNDSLDIALMFVQQAVVPWKCLSQCTVCERDDDQGTLILSAMTIRAVLHLLQRACADLIESSSSDGPSDSNGSGSSSSSPGPFDQLSENSRLMMGRYEATVEEQSLVSYILILQALSKIRSAIVSLKSKLDKTSRHQHGDTNTNTEPQSKDGRSTENNANENKTGTTNSPEEEHAETSPLRLEKGGNGSDGDASCYQDVGCMHTLLRSLDATVEVVGKAIPRTSFSSLSQTNPLAF